MRKTVLIVEDDTVLLRMAKDALAGEPYKVIPAPNVNQGIMILKKVEVHLLVTDYIMPEKTGLDFLAYLDREGYQIPTIMASSTFNDDVKNKARSFGVSYFLDKPYTAMEIRDTVNKLFAESEAK